MKTPLLFINCLAGAITTTDEMRVPPSSPVKLIWKCPGPFMALVSTNAHVPRLAAPSVSAGLPAPSETSFAQ